LKGEDSHIKKGFFGLFTDDTFEVFFDGFKIDPLDCWVDPFDIEKTEHFI